MLLDNGANIHTNRDLLLFKAVDSGERNIVEFLLINGASIDVANFYATGNMLLDDAIASGNQEIVELLKKYMDKNK